MSWGVSSWYGLFMLRRIFAIGGGGFDSESAHGDGLDRFMLDWIGVEKPKVCLIPTASGDSLFRIARFQKSCELLGITGNTLELYRLEVEDIEAYLDEHDLIFVSGGNTRNMLVLWREWGVDTAIRHLYDRGKPLAGVSAGANCWFRTYSTDSNPGGLSNLEGLGWVDEYCCPHYDEEPERKPHVAGSLAFGVMDRALCIDGGVGVVIENEAPVGFAPVGEGKAYWVSESGTEILPKFSR